MTPFEAQCDEGEDKLLLQVLDSFEELMNTVNSSHCLVLTSMAAIFKRLSKMSTSSFPKKLGKCQLLIMALIQLVVDRSRQV
jgi:hypothetical protein